MQFLPHGLTEPGLQFLPYGLTDRVAVPPVQWEEVRAGMVVRPGGWEECGSVVVRPGGWEEVRRGGREEGRLGGSAAACGELQLGRLDLVR